MPEIQRSACAWCPAERPVGGRGAWSRAGWVLHSDAQPYTPYANPSSLGNWICPDCAQEVAASA